MANKTPAVKKAAEIYTDAYSALYDLAAEEGTKIKDVNGVMLCVPKTPERFNAAVLSFYERCDREARLIALQRKAYGQEAFKSVIREVDAKIDCVVRIFEERFGHSPLRIGGYKAHAARVKLTPWG